ncbi:hypothetical protein [Streptomyces sp. NPDC051776]
MPRSLFRLAIAGVFALAAVTALTGAAGDGPGDIGWIVVGAGVTGQV